MRRAWPWALAALVALIPAVRLLGAGASAMRPWLTGILAQVMHDGTSALGAGWLAAYLLVNGSLAADVGVALHHAGALDLHGLFMVVLGARLGASVIVVLMDLLNRLRRKRTRSHGSLGTLSFVITLTLYLPIAMAAVWVVDTNPDPTGGGDVAPSAALLAGGGIIGLWLALWLLDRAVLRTDMQRLHARLRPWLDHPIKAVLVGAGVTAMTASIALSVGGLVPLYQRGILSRRQMIPYLMGASIGTFSDSLLVAMLLGAWDAVAVLAILMGAVTAMTLLALLAYRPYVALVEWIQDALASPSRLAVMGVVLLLVPVALLL